MEARAKVRSGAALQRLLEMGAKDVAVIRDGSERRVPIEELHVGDVFRVSPGEKVATNGVVRRGTSAVDMSLLTGEPVPVDVSPGDPVVGATINSYGALDVRAAKVGADTQLAQIGRLVERAQTGKAPVQRLADRVSAVFVPVVFGIAAVTLLGWLAFGGTLVAALTATVAVLIVACPCALGLATPTALLVGTGRGAELGILIRGPEILESTRAVDTVVLDKTGTVTPGQMSVTAVLPAAGWSEEDVLRLAGSAEQGSEHPIALAIVSAARDRTGWLDDVTGFRATPGEGVEAKLGGQVFRVGRLREAEADPAGSTAVSVTVDGTLAGTIAVADPVKPSSAEAVRDLKALGLRPLLLTGDSAGVAGLVARRVGIADADVRAEVLPDGKVAAVESLQQAGRVVAMVGDGVNDAAALAQADLGVAMGSGSDVAIDASDLTLVRGDVRLVPQAIRLSRATLRTIKGTCSGHSPTTWPRSRWPHSACSTR
jgi:P-type Cu+ transporter